MTIALTNSYARLPERFFVRQNPAKPPAPAMLRLNRALARRLGLDPAALDGDAGAALFSGAELPEGAEPLAMAYAGHQFGNWVPQLGDGRAILLGEVVAPDGARFDIHLKGAGRTPFSRGGDGKAVLSAVLREYLVSEAMAALGIPTTRALAAVTTGERVMREGFERGAVLARVAASHVRVGTFQYFYARRDSEALQALLDHVIARHYPEAAGAENPVLALLSAVVKAQAELVARWLSVGFIHGVMNTDNMAISGETIDYGPCAFLDSYDPNKVFSSIDRAGRYAWGRQPEIALWNLAQFAQTLVPLMGGGEEQAVAALNARLDAFAPAFRAAHDRLFAAKIGIKEPDAESRALVADLMALMAGESVDFTLAYSRLGRDEAGFRALFGAAPVVDWLTRWRARRDSGWQAIMAAANPLYIPRNHRVDAALRAAEAGDMAPFDTLLEVLERPFDARAGFAEYESPPRPEEEIHATFCGT